MAFKASKHFPFYMLFFSQEATRKIYETRVSLQIYECKSWTITGLLEEGQTPSFSILLFRCVPRKTPITWRESGGCKVVFRTTSRNQFQGMLVAHLPSTRLCTACCLIKSGRGEQPEFSSGIIATHILCIMGKSLGQPLLFLHL